MEIKIEKNVPMPIKKIGSLSGLTSILKKMEIGDSVFMESNASNGVAATAKQARICVVTRKEGCGRRIWRVK